MSTAKREKTKTKKPSDWLDKSLQWFSKQLEKWYGPLVAVIGIPLLLIFTLISWPVRRIVCDIRQSIKE